MLLMMLITFVAIMVASLIGTGIRALINSGRNRSVPLNYYPPNQPAAYYQLPNDGGSGRNSLTIYLSKNNQQSGPYSLEQVLIWLNARQLSSEDLAIRQGETQWQPLRTFFSPVSNFSPQTSDTRLIG